LFLGYRGGSRACQESWLALRCNVTERFARTSSRASGRRAPQDRVAQARSWWFERGEDAGASRLQRRSLRHACLSGRHHGERALGKLSRPQRAGCVVAWYQGSCACWMAAKSVLTTALPDNCSHVHMVCCEAGPARPRTSHVHSLRVLVKLDLPGHQQAGETSFPPRPRPHTVACWCGGKVKGSPSCEPQSAASVPGCWLLGESAAVAGTGTISQQQCLHGSHPCAFAPACIQYLRPACSRVRKADLWTHIHAS
jgi:hypothetical protein